MTNQPRRVGRPATGVTPMRSFRMGAIYDRATEVAERRGEKLKDVIEQALHAYVASHEEDTMPTVDSILAAHLGWRLHIDPELDLDDLDSIQDGDGFVLDSPGSHGGKVRRTGVKATDWERVKATARENAQWLIDTDEGAREMDRADYA